MKILYQPTVDAPCDWQECDSAEWSRIGEFAVHALCVQGDVWMGYDRYGLQELPYGRIKIAGICDDTEWKDNERAIVRYYGKIEPDPRPEFGGALNKFSPTVIYAKQRSFLDENARRELTQCKPFASLDDRVFAFKRGVWVPDAQHDELNKSRSIRGWREWVDGVPDELQFEGRICCQRSIGLYRKPDGTLTWYHTTTNREIPYESDNEYENALSTVPASSASSQTVSNISGGVKAWGATTLPEGILSTQWPTSGTYRCQLDITSISSACEVGLLTLDGEIGGFCRCDGTGDIERFEQDESSFTSSGLKMATITDPSWSSGNSWDKLRIRIAANRYTGHSKESVTLELGETDDFVDGPWPSANKGRMLGGTFF